MLSIVETVLTLILTALATLIAVVQFRNEQREAKREEAERQRLESERALIKDLVNCTKQIDSSIDELLHLKTALNDPQAEDRFNKTTIGARKCLEAYGVTLGKISSLYER